MAQTERLLLQVDAATELLRQHLTQAEPALDRFEKRAAKMGENVDRSIGDMGKRFGAFATLAETAAQRAEKSFEASFNQVQRIAATAIKGPTIEGRINLGADDIRAGAAAAQDHARAFALIGEAAERTASEVGDTTEATRLFIAATTASRIEAEQKAAALLAEAGALERVEIELRQSAEAVNLFVGRHQQIELAAAQERDLAAAANAAAIAERALAAAADLLRADIDPMYAAQKRFNDELDRAEALLAAGTISEREYAQAVQVSRDRLYAHAQATTGSVSPTRQLTNSQGALRAAMQGASYQVQDTFTQISLGANVLQVVAIQGGQLAGQFANIEGRAGNLARFMIGPWGLAFTAALLVVGPLIGKLLEMNSATDDAVDKLRKDAEQSEATRAAKAAFATSIDGVTAALRDQDEALRKTAESERTAAERANVDAQAKRNQALATRQATVAALEHAKAQLAVLSTPGASDARLAPARDEAAAAVSSLDAQLAKANAAVADAERQLNVSRVDLAAEQAATAIDPVKSVTKLYDDRIRALKNQQREEARLGHLVGTESKRRIQQLEAEKKAAIDAAQARVSAAKRTPSPTANNQVGREITVDDARRIVAGFGGHVTSGFRSRATQEAIYADKLAGRHIGPVAKPGTSDHERGQAVDIAYGAGITIAKIKSEFAKQGVALRQVLDEPSQRVFHVAFGKRGPAQSVLDKREESARVKAINEKLAYDEEERAAQRRLIEATRGTALTEEQRDKLAVDDINAQAAAQKKKVAAELDEGKIDKAQAAHLDAVNEATRVQLEANVKADAALRTLGRRYDAEQDDLQSRLAILRISGDLATTDADRRAVAGQILAIEQELRRKALEKLRDTSQDPAEVQKAKDQLARLPALDRVEREQSDRQNAGPLDQYRQRLHEATDDMDGALERVKVHGLQTLEDGLLGIVDGTETVGSAFRKMASSIIADLARIAIEKAIVSAIGGSFLGFADGGSLGSAPGFADGGELGGLIRGPGSGRSDSILALLKGPNGGAVRLSNREFIMNAAAVAHYGADALHALNARRVPRFADGGLLGPTPNVRLREPRLPNMAGSRRDRLIVETRSKVEASPLLLATVQETAVRTVSAAADPIMDGAKTRTMKALNRPELPGGYG